MSEALRPARFTGSGVTWWVGLDLDQTMGWQLRCTRDLIALRKAQPALRGDNVHAFCKDDYARVLAFHRWLEGSGQDVIVVATLAENMIYGYPIGFPFPGHWTECFNSDVYGKRAVLAACTLGCSAVMMFGWLMLNCKRPVCAVWVSMCLS